MQSITELLSLDHERCDAMFERIAAAVATGNSQQAQAAFGKFNDAMQHHFAIEEAVLFPAFEQLDGSDLGLTLHMRLEHEQMHELISEMQAALNSGSPASCNAPLATLSPLMQQHNLKEEQLLYPLLDQALGEKAAELIERIEALPHTGS